MNISFWTKVSSKWQSLQAEVSESRVDLGLLRKTLQNDIDAIKEPDAFEENKSEIEEDFWGGL
ncbi:hypothetical protein L1279_001135 [Planomicrobium sp. HSC-17F08]|nr:hypothetical protein [Planomicrobium sp. HSC-17F08]